MSAECAFWNDYLPRLRAWADSQPSSLQCDITSEPINGNIATNSITMSTVSVIVIFSLIHVFRLW